MKKPLDRISEAYYGKLGHSFAEKVRSRIHWICENAIGEKILDVGCSQGIISIILGREGKTVYGIDLLEESIQYAQEKLENEEVHTKNNIIFEHANFMTKEFDDGLYDSIIFGEVLEHITDPRRFMVKAQTLLKPGGRVIITVPFGINDYFDHKKTYYINDVLDFKTELLKPVHIEFLGKWVGMIFEAEHEKEIKLNKQLIKKLEVEFYNTERELLEKNRRCLEINKKLESEKSELNKQKKDLIDEVKKLSLIVDSYKSNEKDLERQLAVIEDDKQKCHKQIVKYTDTIKKLNEKNIEYITKIENVRKQVSEIKEIKTELNELREKIVEYEFQSKVDKELINEYKIKDIQDDNTVLVKQIEELKMQVTNLVNEKEKQEETSKLRNELVKEKRKNDMLQKELKKLKSKEKENSYKKLRLAVKEKINANERLLESYEKEERLLKSYNALRNKYEALSNSKLGSIQLAYWRKKGERRRLSKVNNVKK